MKRTAHGTFARQLPIWTPDAWDAGYVDSRGYFRVYRPDYPRAWANGYSHRHVVVWWLATGVVAPEDIHHKDGDRTNDRFENLESKTHLEHAQTHNKKLPPLLRTCVHCQRRFELSRDRNPRERGKFCGQTCYHAHPRSQHHKAAIAAGLSTAYKEGRR